MAIDPRLPVIVGAGQLVRRPAPGQDLDEAPEPALMMGDALRAAGRDTGAGDRLLKAASSIRVMATLSWSYANPALLLASMLGTRPTETVLSTTGGNSPQLLVNDSAEAIARGDHDVILLAGAEAVSTRLLARKAEPKVWLGWTQQEGGTTAPRLIGDELPGTHPAEAARSVVLPVQIYPMFENALRAAGGETVAQHQERISRLWSRFSSVAARNAFAWSPLERSPEEIATPGPDNRMIAFPYTKLMCANIQTDQAAALVMCSVEAARAAGVPRDNWVFVHSGTEAHDHWFVSERENLRSSPAIRAAGRLVLSGAGIGIDDVAHMDLYSCFPSAVEIAAAELGVALDDEGRIPTVTGGLGFAGGPGNNYSTHAIATMTGVLRGDPGSYGLVSALGWYVTKHAFGVYSSEPPRSGFRRANPQAEVDALARRGIAEDFAGDVEVETYTVTYERDGSPSLGLASCLLADGRRAWGQVRDEGALAAMVQQEQCGRPARLSSGGSLELR